MKAVLQVSSLNQSLLFEMGTTQQSSLSKHCHNRLSETLASSFCCAAFLWYPGVAFIDVYIYVHLLVVAQC